MSNIIAPGSSVDVNVKVTALTTNPNVPTTYKTIILKKNLVNGVNTLIQSMINKSNTIYVIKYDFIIGENITVPANCILDFYGGSIKGSNTITFNNTIIKTTNNNIFDLNIILAGDIKSKVCLEWFGYISSPTNDAAPYFLKAINAGFDIQLLESTYYINTQIAYSIKNLHIYGMGNNSIIKIQYNGFVFVFNGLEGANNGVNLIIRNVYVTGNFPEPWNENQTETLTSFFKNNNGYIYFAEIYDSTFTKLNEAFNFTRGYWTRVDRCHFLSCKNAIHTSDANSSSFTNNQFRWIKEHSMWISNSDGGYPGTGGINITGNDFSSNSASIIFIDGVVANMTFTGNYLEPAIEQYIPNSITWGIQVGVENNNYGEEGVTIPTLTGCLIAGNTGFLEQRNSKRCGKAYGEFSYNIVTMSFDLSDSYQAKNNIGQNEYDDDKVKSAYSFLDIYSRTYIKGNKVTNIIPRTLQLNQITIPAKTETEVFSIQGKYLILHDFNLISSWTNVQLIIYDENNQELFRINLTEDSINKNISLSNMGQFKFKIYNNNDFEISNKNFLITYSVSNYTKLY